MERRLFDLRDILDADSEPDIRRGLAALADELNSGLTDYEVTLVHLDTADYLAFEPIAEQGDYWNDNEE